MFLLYVVSDAGNFMLQSSIVLMLATHRGADKQHREIEVKFKL